MQMVIDVGKIAKNCAIPFCNSIAKEFHCFDMLLEPHVKDLAHRFDANSESWVRLFGRLTELSV